MNHILTYSKFNENMSNSHHSKGDVIMIKYDDQNFTAKITNVLSENSYIVNIKTGSKYDPKPVAITGDNIVMDIRNSAEDDATSNWVKVKNNVISNDMTVNNYPGNDGNGNGVYSPS